MTNLISSALSGAMARHPQNYPGFQWARVKGFIKSDGTNKLAHHPQSTRRFAPTETAFPWICVKGCTNRDGWTQQAGEPSALISMKSTGRQTLHLSVHINEECSNRDGWTQQATEESTLIDMESTGRRSLHLSVHINKDG